MITVANLGDADGVTQWSQVASCRRGRELCAENPDEARICLLWVAAAMAL